MVWAEMVMGRNGHGPKWLWAEMTSDHRDERYNYRSGMKDLWTFRDLDFSRVVLSRPTIGPFATWYFSHLFDPGRFAIYGLFATWTFRG